MEDSEPGVVYKDIIVRDKTKMGTFLYEKPPFHSITTGAEMYAKLQLSDFTCGFAETKFRIWLLHNYSNDTT